MDHRDQGGGGGLHVQEAVRYDLREPRFVSTDLDDRIVQRLLVREVLEQKGLRNACRRGQLLRGRGVKAVMGEDRPDGLDDRMAPFIGRQA